MRILLTCDPEIPVPPGLYGGIERIVDGLANGYTKAGHKVYLVAHPSSTCKYTTDIFFWPALSSRGLLNVWKNSRHLYKVAKKVMPDVIHSFSRLLYGYPIFVFCKFPFVQSYQRAVSARSTGIALKVAGSKLRFTSCAAHMVKELPARQAFTIIFNFTDVNYFTNDESIKREHLMYLGRIENIKGTKEAIEAAISSKMKIVVAGNIQTGHEEYFKAEIKPLLANALVQYVGAIDDKKKRYYLQRSKALLFPVKWEEPFGIVLAEALACGTPVIGFNRGSVPEVINPGKNGFIVNTVDEMISYINKIDILDHTKIRNDAVDRFSLHNITCQYLNLLTDGLGGEKNTPVSGGFRPAATILQG